MKNLPNRQRPPNRSPLRPSSPTWQRISPHPFVTVDTEFFRESTYYPLLCVAQMAAPKPWSLTRSRQGLDLSPFFKLMANARVIKVFHAARQDIEIMWHRGLIPHPIFDTQVAAMVLGHGDSISYEQLVQRITGDRIDKSHRFSDWTKRPLCGAQLVYAMSDVTHLRDVYLALVGDLSGEAAPTGSRRKWASDLAGHLSDGAGERVAAAQDTGPQAEGARGADRGRRLA